MGASDGQSRCRAAVEYYYDLLHGDDAAVPEVVRDHVESCSSCREQMRRLGEALSEADRDAGSSARLTFEETVEALTGHLELVDEQVTCAHVKPFLPRLAASALEIRIPTPITVHADRCPPCAGDVATIRALGLTADQLARLSRVFADSSRQRLRSCRRARPTVTALATFSLDDIDAQSLNHISRCPRCRAAVYRRRQRLPKPGPGEARGPAATCCTWIATTDLFDLVVPYDVTAGGKGQRKAILTHVRTCPSCVERTQVLHRTLYGIAERADSGTTTVYRTRETSERVAEAADDAARRYPVHVQIAQGRPEPAAGPDGPYGTQRVDARRGSPTRIVLAVAAFVLASLLFTTTPTASSTHVGDILRAIQRETNIRVLSFFGTDPEPFREVWLARDLKVLATKCRTECVLFDLRQRSRKTIDSDRGTCTTVRLTSREYHSVRKFMMDGTGGVFAGVPSDTRLQEAAVDPGGTAEPATLVYELNVTGQRCYGGDPAVAHRYRIFIDRATKLPQRIECFRKGGPENEWTLSVCHTLQYVTERDVKDAIRTMCLGG